MPPPGASAKASQAPSGDQATAETWSSRAVTRSGQPPAVLTVHTWGRPLRSVMKARRVASGEKVGDQQAPMRAMRATRVARSSGGGAPAWSAGGTAGVAVMIARPPEVQGAEGHCG